MWANNITALVEYGLVICKEWISRGYKDTCYDKIAAFGVESCPPMPWWLGYRDLHTSHQANLVRKNPDHYKPFWPNVDSTILYIWPDNNTRSFKTI
jgi:hypothetical protein